MPTQNTQGGLWVGHVSLFVFQTPKKTYVFLCWFNKVNGYVDWLNEIVRLYGS